jgi:hypothetical protein
VAASVRQRLLTLARDEKRPFAEVLQYFAMERFLYRLSCSSSADAFVLKGALMLRVWQSPADGLVFQPGDMRIDRIQGNAEYGGFRVRVPGRLTTAHWRRRPDKRSGMRSAVAWGGTMRRSSFWK